MLYRTFQCFVYLICKLSNMKTNLLVLSMNSTKIYVKKILEEIIKKSINKFGLTFRNIACISFGGHCTTVEDKKINYF